MASQQENSYVGCGISMPLEDGHDKCVLCLGRQHAILSRENKQACMDCFIMPACTREARCHFFGGKRADSSQSEVPRGKIVKMAKARREIGQCPGSWRVPLSSPFPRPATDRPHISPLPPSSSVLETQKTLI